MKVDYEVVVMDEAGNQPDKTFKSLKPAKAWAQEQSDEYDDGQAFAYVMHMFKNEKGEKEIADVEIIYGKNY